MDSSIEILPRNGDCANTVGPLGLSAVSRAVQRNHGVDLGTRADIVGRLATAGSERGPEPKEILPRLAVHRDTSGGRLSDNSICVIFATDSTYLISVIVWG
jgi:hypothetical protein